jgi:hypothetical protein
MVDIVKKIISNSGNIQSILMQGLNKEHPDAEDTIQCIIAFSSFNRSIGYGRPSLMDNVSAIFPASGNHKREVQFIAEELSSSISNPVADAEVLIDKVISHFHGFHDLELKCECSSFSQKKFQSET